MTKEQIEAVEQEASTGSDSIGDAFAEVFGKQPRVFVTTSGLEQLQNAGRARIQDLLIERMKNVERKMANILSNAGNQTR